MLQLAPNVKTRFEIASRKLRDNVMVKRWVSNDYRVKVDLLEEVRAYEVAKGFKPDYIIFDWLGASTEELGANNGVRNSLKAKSYEIDELAKQENITILYYMQAGEQYKNERYINQAHVDECKTAGQKAAAVIGWSALPNKGDGTQLASNGVHQDQQTMSVGKSRFGKGGFFGVMRKFAVQAFDFPK